VVAVKAEEMEAKEEQDAVVVDEDEALAWMLRRC
jgi:hypothetical protein